MASNGTAEVGDNADYKFDGLVICDESDYDYAKSSLNPLENESISLCYVFDGKEPNTTLYRNVDLERKKSRCIIIYISESFCVNELLKHVTECIAQPGSAQKIITLITKESIQPERFSWLAQSVRVHHSSNNWLLKLSKEIKSQLPLFYKHVLPRDVSGILHCKGLNLSNLEWEVYGVKVRPGDLQLKIDLDGFARHVKVHQKIKISEVCGQCSYLRTVDTSVELILHEKLPSPSSKNEECMKELAKLCSCVMDVMEPYRNNTIWSLGCTVKGKPIKNNALLKRLFNAVHYSLAEKGLGIINKIFYKNYTNKNSRMKSFEGQWPSEKFPTVIQLAEAGFFFSKAPQETRCFHCGVCVVAWDTNDDPWLAHAGICPFCPYIKSNMSVKRIEEAKQLALQVHKVPSNMYDNIDARVESFRTFDTKHLKDFKSCGKDRDTLIKAFAEAGFYFNGSVDLVKCFSCGLVLSSINPKHDLSITHARTYPNCNHILNGPKKEIVQAALQIAEIEANDDKSHIVFLLRTLDNTPRREWPFNIFRPV